MSHQEPPSVDRLNNEIARLTIERNRYHKSLSEIKDYLWDIWRQTRQNPDKHIKVSTNHIAMIAQTADDTWRFRQPGCPKCGMPCEFMFIMIEVGPDIRSWDCPSCGKIVNTNTVFEKETT